MDRLLLLIRIALRNTPLEEVEYQELRSWDRMQWQETLDAAKAQSLTGMVYHALSLVPPSEEGLLPDDLFFPLVARADGIERKNRKLAALAAEISARLTAAGLHPRVIKGPETARFYPLPELREYGDIDLYLPAEEIPALRRMVEDGEMDPDGTFHFREQGIDMDVHTHWLDLPCPAESLPPFPSPEATLLQLSVHILKHAVGTGVGLRQVVDLAAAARTLDYRPEELKACYEKLHLGKWNRLISSFLEEYLDIPNRMCPGERIAPEPLLRIILEGGNFGHHAPSRTQALGHSKWRRKADTALRFLRRMPFSLRYAPRLAFSTFFNLTKGNLHRPR